MVEYMDACSSIPYIVRTANILCVLLSDSSKLRIHRNIMRTHTQTIMFVQAQNNLKTTLDHSQIENIIQH